VVTLVDGGIERGALEPDLASVDRIGNRSGRLVHGQFGLGDTPTPSVEAEEADRSAVAAEIVFALVLVWKLSTRSGIAPIGRGRIDGE